MDPIAIIDEYLDLCEQRRLKDAARFLENGAKLIFPGGRLYTGLEEMIDDARSRYRWVGATAGLIDIPRKMHNANGRLPVPLS